MRRFSKRQPLEVVKELDAFPKIPESYVETSSSGGGGETMKFSSVWWIVLRCLVFLFLFYPSMVLSCIMFPSEKLVLRPCCNSVKMERFPMNGIEFVHRKILELEA